MGLLCFMPVLFYSQLIWVLPGLEDPRIARALLWGGLLFFLSGAGLYYFLRQQKAKRLKESSDLDDDV